MVGGAKGAAAHGGRRDGATRAVVARARAAALLVIFDYVIISFHDICYDGMNDCLTEAVVLIERGDWLAVAYKRTRSSIYQAIELLCDAVGATSIAIYTCLAFLASLSTENLLRTGSVQYTQAFVFSE